MPLKLEDNPEDFYYICRWMLAAPGRKVVHNKDGSITAIDFAGVGSLNYSGSLAQVKQALVDFYTPNGIIKPLPEPRAVPDSMWDALSADNFNNRT